MRLGLAFSALMFSVPFFIPVHMAPIGSFWAEWLAMAFGLGACLALAQRTARPPPIFYGLLALICILLLQIGTGMVAWPARSLVAVGLIVWAAALALAGAQLRDYFGLPLVARVLQLALGAAGFFAAIVGLMQITQVTIFSIRFGPEEMVGLIGQRNHLANLMACGLVSLAYYALERRAHVGRFFMAIPILMAVPILIALPLTGSRSVWAYLVIALAVLSQVARGFPMDARRVLHRGSSTGFLIHVAILIAGAVAIALFCSDAGPRLFSTFNGNIGDTARRAYAKYALAMFLQSPLLGVGWGGFAYATFNLAPQLQIPLELPEMHAHNLLLQLAAETGLAGVLAIGVPLALWLVRNLFPIRGGSAAWLATLVLIQLFHGMVEFPHWYAYFLGPLALLLGLGDVSRETSAPAPAGRWRLGERACMVLLILGGLVGLGIVAHQEARLQDWQREVQTLQAKGAALTEAHFERLFWLGGDWLGWRLAPAIAVYSQPGTDAETAAALALTGQALRAHPLPALAEHQALLLDAAGRPAEAARIRRAAAILAKPAK